MRVHLDRVVWTLDDRPGVVARLSSMQSPMLNLVGLADDTEGNAGFPHCRRH